MSWHRYWLSSGCGYLVWWYEQLSSSRYCGHRRAKTKTRVASKPRRTKEAKAEDEGPVWVMLWTVMRIRYRTVITRTAIKWKQDKATRSYPWPKSSTLQAWLSQSQPHIQPLTPTESGMGSLAFKIATSSKMPYSRFSNGINSKPSSSALPPAPRFFATTPCMSSIWYVKIL